MDKILDFFIRNPEKEFHVRQISKLTRRSPTTVSKYLKEFEKKEILKSEKKLNHLLFKANTENTRFKQLKLNYNLNLLNNSGIMNYLIREFNHPEAIILFGSFSRAEDTSLSDIDLLVINPSKKEIELDEFEKKLSRKIQVFIRSKQDIEKMKYKNKELLNNWINGIVIYGFWEVFK